MRWLIDEMFPLAVAEELRARGHDAVAVAERDLQGAADDVVFDLAVREGRVVVTENFADFAALVEGRQAGDEPCIPVVFARKSSLPVGGALAARLADRLATLAKANPDPYQGLHWP